MSIAPRMMAMSAYVLDSSDASWKIVDIASSELSGLELIVDEWKQLATCASNRVTSSHVTSHHVTSRHAAQVKARCASQGMLRSQGSLKEAAGHLHAVGVECGHERSTRGDRLGLEGGASTRKVARNARWYRHLERSPAHRHACGAGDVFASAVRITGELRGGSAACLRKVQGERIELCLFE